MVGACGTHGVAHLWFVRASVARRAADTELDTELVAEHCVWLIGGCDFEHNFTLPAVCGKIREVVDSIKMICQKFSIVCVERDSRDGISIQRYVHGDVLLELERCQGVESAFRNIQTLQQRARWGRAGLA